MIFSSARNPLQNHTWIEVTHCKLTKETGGYWTYHSPGSGVWVNTGNSIALSQHDDLDRKYWKRFDSVQFMHHVDQNCGNSGIEVVFPHFEGKFACGPVMRAGWNASRPCKCYGDVRRVAYALEGGTTECARCA